MALPEGGGSGAHHQRPVGGQLDLAQFADAHRGALHERGDADARQHRVLGGAAAGLLGAQVLVSGRLQGPLQGGAVVAGVVGAAHRVGVREPLGTHEVEAAHLGGVHADPGGVEVDGTLDGEDRLGPARAPVGGDRSGVGDVAAPACRRVGDVVAAGEHLAGVRRQEGADHRVGARVLHDLELVVGDAAAAGAAEAELLALAPAVHRRGEVLGPGLGPCHRTADSPCEPGQDELLRRRGALGPETAAHIWGHHPHGGLVEPVEAGQGVPHPVRGLGGGVERQPGAVGGPFDRRRPGLQRHGRQPLVGQRAGHHDLAAREVDGGLDTSAGTHVEGDVRAGVWVDQRVARGRVGQRHRRGPRLDVDEHVLSRVGGCGGCLGHHHRQRLAHEPDGVAGQHGAGHGLVDHRYGLEIGKVQVGRGERSEHTGLGPGLGRVHADEASAGHGRANEARMGRAVEVQVGHVAGAFGEHPRILGTKHPVPQHAHARVSVSVPVPARNTCRW